MRRLVVLIGLSMPFAPFSVGAQLTLQVGGGITNPIGDFADVAGAGYHVRGAVDLGVPTLPLSLRADGDYHRLAEASTAFEAASVLGASLSVVYTLPGVGLSPYLLGGVGRYRLASGPAGLSTSVGSRGLHAGFGVSLGASAFGGFVEIRYVGLDGSTGDAKYVPLTFGLRL